jgi:hypothetical protein
MGMTGTLPRVMEQDESDSQVWTDSAGVSYNEGKETQAGSWGKVGPGAGHQWLTPIILAT